MDRLKNIVVGVDFSDFSKVALRQAVRMAGRNQAKLHLLHVVQDSVVGDLQDALPGDTQNLAQEVRGAAMERLDQMVAEIGPETEGIEVATDVVVGTPLIEILRRVRDTSADLLILGVKGSTARGMGVGTLATKCVRRAAAKVMLVHPDHGEQFKSVIACVDFSESSERVLEQAVRICSRDRAKLNLIHAYYPPWKVLHYMAPTSQASPDYQKAYQRLLTDRLNALMKPFEAEATDLEVECHLVECSEAVEGIVEFQKESGANLVVLGTRGRTGLRSLLLGTTAEKILQETKCSILAVKPAGFTYDPD